MKKISNIIIVVGFLASIFYVIRFKQENEIYDMLNSISLILVLLIPKIIRKFKIKISDVNELIYIVFVILAQLFGSIMQLYSQIYWYDTFCHFLSGIIVSCFVFELLIKKNYKLDNLGFVLMIIGCSSIVAQTWEFFEFTISGISGKDIQKVLTTGVTDTMKDIFVAFLGSSLFSLSYLYEKLNNKNLIITKIKNKIQSN